MQLIVKMIFGSHLYGTSTAESDTDYKGVFLPCREDILLGRIPKSNHLSTGDDFSRNTSCDIDIEFYSLHYFIKLACQGQTVAMDMLHAPDAMILENSPVWQTIVKNRNRFYSKNLKAFIRYARSQAGKYGVKGSRLNAVNQVLTLLKQYDGDLKMRVLWEQLPRIEHCYDVPSDPNGMRQYQVCGKSFQESAAIGYVAPILEKFANEYGHRANLAAMNENVDWKAISHALRAAYQIKEILSRNTLTFPLAQASFLKAVKQGRIDFRTEAGPVLETLMDEIEELCAQSRLPDKADTEFWDRFICSTLEKEIFASAPQLNHFS
ncbi:nucleotidyltransferase domain-containing protein [Desulfococcaceae bacterium HSG9]|nr:nucleotidyltransferase domain-containing protein [Desulfococcaceae bacterium HSG9]